MKSSSVKTETGEDSWGHRAVVQQKRGGKEAKVVEKKGNSRVLDIGTSELISTESVKR